MDQDLGTYPTHLAAFSSQVKLLIILDGPLQGTKITCNVNQEKCFRMSDFMYEADTCFRMTKLRMRRQNYFTTK